MANTSPEIPSDIDLYLLLGVSSDASENEIKKSYRKVALKYHPDKNPSKDASDKFNFLLRALEILTTPHLRSKYDQSYNLRRQHQSRIDSLDKVRKKLQENLEQREFIASTNTTTSKTQVQLQKRKIQILKEEGIKRRKTKDKFTFLEPNVQRNFNNKSHNYNRQYVIVKWSDFTLPITKKVNIRLKNILDGNTESIATFCDFAALSSRIMTASKAITIIGFRDDYSARKCILSFTNNAFSKSNILSSQSSTLYVKNFFDEGSSSKIENLVDSSTQMLPNAGIETKILTVRKKLSLMNNNECDKIIV